MKSKSLFLFITLSVIAFTGCKQSNDDRDQSSVEVKVINPIINTQATILQNYSGTIEEDNSTALSFSTMGTIKSLYIHDGQHISKGQLIGVIDDTSFKSAYSSAKAMLVQMDDAHARMKQLHDKGSLPEIQWIDSESKLKQAESAEQIARKALDDTKLFAPCSGVISGKSVEVGQNVAPGIPIAKIVGINKLNVKISVPEQEIAKINLGQKANISVDALQGKTFKAIVSEKNVVANKFTRSYDVKMRIESSDAKLMPGMICRVALSTAANEQNKLILPVKIVQLDEENNSFVWLDVNGKAEKRIVKVGGFLGDDIEIVSGISSDDRIICEGQQKVCNGTKLTVKK